MAAGKALRKISAELVEQLDLVETTIHLHKSNGLTPLELEKLSNFYTTSLERKQYLVTTIIPSQGHYEGMRLLRRALKRSEQNEILKILEKAYEDAVDTIIADKLEITPQMAPQMVVNPQIGRLINGAVKRKVKMSARAGDSIQARNPENNYCCDSVTSVILSESDMIYTPPPQEDDDGGDSTTSTGSDSSDEDNYDTISLDDPEEELDLPLVPSSIDINVKIPFSHNNTTMVSVSSLHQCQSADQVHWPTAEKSGTTVNVNIMPEINPNCDEQDKVIANVNRID